MLYRYKAIDQNNNEEKSGTIEAATADVAIAALHPVGDISLLPPSVMKFTVPVGCGGLPRKLYNSSPAGVRKS